MKKMSGKDWVMLWVDRFGTGIGKVKSGRGSTWQGDWRILLEEARGKAIGESIGKAIGEVRGEERLVF